MTITPSRFAGALGTGFRPQAFACGFSQEVRCALRVAVAWGYVKAEDAAVSMELIDRINAMLYRLTH